MIVMLPASAVVEARIPDEGSRSAKDNIKTGKSKPKL
jgi:hypothetical protein